MFAGEVSGENHGYHLIQAFHKVFPEAQLSGIGGGKMISPHFFSLGEITSLNAFQLSHFKRFTLKRKLDDVLKTVEEYVSSHPPAAFIFIGIADDTQYFVMKLIAMAKKYQIKTYYYFSPHVWLWSRKKTLKVSSEVDAIFTFFDREENAYRNAGAWTVPVSHPILDELPEKAEKPTFCSRYGINASAQVISFIYGSRKAEIKHNGRVIRRVVKQLEKIFPDAVFVSALTEDRADRSLRKSLMGFKNHQFLIRTDDYYSLIGSADVSLTCSGTASLETAVYRTPQVIFYRMNRISYLFWRLAAFFWGVKDICIGMPNIILGKKTIPEHIQPGFWDDKLVNDLTFLLKNLDNQNEELNRLVEQLGVKGGIIQAVNYIKKTLENL